MPCRTATASVTASAATGVGPLSTWWPRSASSLPVRSTAARTSSSMTPPSGGARPISTRSGPRAPPPPAAPDGPAPGRARGGAAPAGAAPPGGRERRGRRRRGVRVARGGPGRQVQQHRAVADRAGEDVLGGEPLEPVPAVGRERLARPARLEPDDAAAGGRHADGAGAVAARG